MKSIKVELPTTLLNAEIIVFADNHWADPNSDHDKIRADIDYVLNKDNAFCVLNGDLMDCAIASSIGDTYGTRLYVNTSAKMNYGGYGESGGFKPPCTDTPIIILNGTRKEMRATL